MPTYSSGEFIPRYPRPGWLCISFLPRAGETPEVLTHFDALLGAASCNYACVRVLVLERLFLALSGSLPWDGGDITYFVVLLVCDLVGVGRSSVFIAS